MKKSIIALWFLLVLAAVFLIFWNKVPFFQIVDHDLLKRRMKIRFGSKEAELDYSQTEAFSAVLAKVKVFELNVVREFPGTDKDTLVFYVFRMGKQLKKLQVVSIPPSAPKKPVNVKKTLKKVQELVR